MGILHEDVRTFITTCHGYFLVSDQSFRGNLNINFMSVCQNAIPEIL
jgi:hypothetical protein